MVPKVMVKNVMIKQKTANEHEEVSDQNNNTICINWLL